MTRILNSRFLITTDFQISLCWSNPDLFSRTTVITLLHLDYLKALNIIKFWIDKNNNTFHLIWWYWIFDNYRRTCDKKNLSGLEILISLLCTLISFEMDEWPLKNKCNQLLYLSSIVWPGIINYESLVIIFVFFTSSTKIKYTNEHKKKKNGEVDLCTHFANKSSYRKRIWEGR